MDPSSTLEERVRTAHDRLSPRHRRLVEYLLHSDSAAAFSTARQLAETLGMSESTVVRLAPELGYDGFPALQAEFQQRLLARLERRAPISPDIGRIPNNPTTIMAQALENDIKSIQDTLATVDPKAFERAVAAILEARNVYILGLRAAAAHAIYATMRLRLVRHNTHLLSINYGDLADQMLTLRHGDLLLVICYPRYATDSVQALRYARGRGIRTVVVTDDPLSPPAKAAGIVLIAAGLPSMLLHSLVAPLSLLNALVSAVAALDRERSSRQLVQAYEAIERFNVLLAPDTPPELRDGNSD